MDGDMEGRVGTTYSLHIERGKGTWIRWKEERNVKKRKKGMEGRQRRDDEKERENLMWKK